jgi:bifunctional non-homologous end joining protein LigD
VDPPRREPHVDHGRSLPAVGPDPLPRSLVPMKATAGDLPTDEGWAFEVKWDGMRALTWIDGPSWRVQSVNERDVTASWPELAGLAEALPAATALLDGELVATDEAGRPDFGRLQQRMHVSDPAEARRRAAEVPVTYVVFDLLHLDGHDLMGRPWSDRRRLLDQVVEPGVRWRPSPVHDDGAELLTAADERGLEGVVAKRVDSIYVPGSRARTWRKVKVRRRQEMVVGGWLPGEGTRQGRLGALLVGYHEEPGDGPLRYAGRVGTGFREAELQRLAAVLADLEDDACPFDPPPPRADLVRGATWVRPELVAELAFGEWTGDGRLRHPSYLGQRIDKDARDVTRDP